MKIEDILKSWFWISLHQGTLSILCFRIQGYMLSLMNEVDPCLLFPLCVLYEMQNQIFQHFSLLLGFQRVGLLRREGKMINWCMPLFLLCFPLSLFTTFFPFLSQFFFVLSFLLFSSSGSFFPWVRIHQLFLVCCGHPFRTVHPPIGCPTTTTTG